MAEPAPQKAPRRKSKTNEDNPSVIDYGETPEQTVQSTSRRETDREKMMRAREALLSGFEAESNTAEPKLAQTRTAPSLGIRVYLSYSRKDTEFAKALYNRLVSAGYDIWADWEDIPLSSNHLDELRNGRLQTSDAFLFIISPDSLNSDVSYRELNEAIKQNKSIIPILHRELESGTMVHREIGPLKHIYMRDVDELERQFPSLVDALSAPSVPTTTLDFAHNDRPTGKDQLDYQSYARAFAQILASPHTKPPLTVGLYASWGMGKSFLMNKIKEELRAKERRSKEKSSKSRTRKVGEKELVFHFIDFNAWEYSTSDNLWAGMITSLYGQVEKAYKPWQITRFRWTKRFRKNLRKTFGWGGVFTLLGVILAAFLQGDTLLQVTDSLSNLQELFGTAFLSGSTLAALIAFLRAARDLFESTAPRSKELQSIVSRKDFSTQIGFMDEIKGEIGEMLTLIKNIEKGKREVRFVLFVDDLDRCPPNKAIEVLEALLLLLSYQEGEAPFFIFLAIDARVIVKAIEVHYGKMLTEAGISGYEFLDKVVQIPFRIPPAGPTAMKKYITSLLWQSEEARTEAENRRPGLAPVVAASVEPAPGPTPTPSSTPEVLPEPIPEEPFDKGEQTAFESYAPFITANPRRMKRIVNVYRITRYLLNMQGESTVPRESVIKWVVISEEWPFRTAWMLQQIEDDYQLGIGLSKTPDATLLDIYQKIKHHVKDERAKPLLALDSDPESFDQFITLDPTISVQDIYDTLRPLTFNLNPAMRSEVLRAAAVNNLQA